MNGDSDTHGPEAGAETATEAANRSRYADGQVLASYAESGWSDPGEAAALLSVADAARGLPILDLGVGVGRTVPLLRLLSADYTGLDYVAEMVAACRTHFPSERFVEGDARDLSTFADDRFGLVVFSYNGIDSLESGGRAAVLREARRVLRPGGTFVFSAHNIDGPVRRDRPWHVKPVLPVPRSQHVVHAARRVVELPRAYRAFRTRGGTATVGPDRAMLPTPAHGFSLRIHYISVPAQVADLQGAGFEDVHVFGSLTGAAVDPQARSGTEPWLHYVAVNGSAGSSQA